MATATITPQDLAEELGRDAKIVRAYLRKEFARDPESKNSRWEIDAKTAKAVRDHFTPAEEKAS